MLKIEKEFEELKKAVFRKIKQQGESNFARQHGLFASPIYQHIKNERVLSYESLCRYAKLLKIGE